MSHQPLFGGIHLDPQTGQAVLNKDKPGPLARATGSGQLTKGARHYGFTTNGAASHLSEMLAEDRAFPDGTPDVWTDLTNFDRACIRELLAWAREHGLETVSPNVEMSNAALTDPRLPDARS